MSKNIILIIIAIAVISGIGYWIYQSEVSTVVPFSQGNKDCVNDDDCVVFGKTGDCNCGCYNKNNLPSGTGGECFCLAPTSCKCVNNKCEGVFDEAASKEEAIKKLFAEKYSKEMTEITIDISRETENYISGGVEFQPGGPENSGMFLAVKVNGSWKLVYDGQGIIPCSDIESYNFPVDMVVECFDEKAGKVKDRAGEACVNSGGKATSSLCCKSTGDYPNLCLIGPCGCSPDNSHTIKVCDCGEGKCFDGNACIPQML